MNTSRTLVGVVAGLAAGTIAGFFIGRSSPRDVHMIAETPEAKDRAIESVSSTAGRNAAPAAGESLDERLRKLVSVPTYLGRIYEAERMFATMTLEDLPGALASVSRMPGAYAQYALLAGLFRRWGELDPQAALSALSDVPMRKRKTAKLSALGGWAATDPYAAWAYVKANPPTSAAEHQVNGIVLGEMSKVDLPRALSETFGLDDRSLRMMTATRIVATAAESGRMPLLVAELQRLAASAERDNLIRDAFKQWSALDAEAPLVALNAMTDPALARSATTGMLSGWAESDPLGAVAYALEKRGDPLVAESLGSVVQAAVENAEDGQVRAMVDSLRETGVLERVADPLLSRLSREHPQFALELIRSLPDDPGRHARANSILSTWSREHFTAAAAYYDEMPPSAAKAQALSGISREALPREGGAAMVERWLGGLSEADRVTALRNIVGSWALRGNQLPPESRAMLARAVANTPGLPDSLRQHAAEAFGPQPQPSP